MSYRWLGICSAAAIALAAQGSAAQSIPGSNPLKAAIEAEAAVRAQFDATLLAAIQGLQEGSDTTRCYAAHLVRANGTEMRFTVFTFNNGDLQHAATIERLTFRNADGEVIHDSGPRVGVPLPVARAVNPPRDISTVPPGGSYFISTTDLWGFNGIPGIPLDIISMQVEVSKAGKRSLFQVQGREIARERIFINGQPTVGAERAANQAPCFPVDRAD